MRFLIQNIRDELQIEEDYLLTTYNTEMSTKNIALVEINDNIFEKPEIVPAEKPVKKGVKRYVFVVDQSFSRGYFLFQKERR